MASSIVPIITSGVAALLPLVPGIIAQVEQLFGSGSGDKKLAAATGSLKTAAEHAVQANKMPEVPSDDALSAVIQTVFQLLKNSGKLPTGIGPQVTSTPPQGGSGVPKPDVVTRSAPDLPVAPVTPTPISLTLPPTVTATSGQKITIVGTVYVGEAPKGVL